ncbi:unnamed protein product [Prorocentrum cordatum]|uniref:Uncharacterized protein n=1 Tax=Prorocentrum cordatum TaxID=2364126 RepID=A0ABN9YH75_9DINO|nr:unnamed protein product [Polarella glacialis]
MRDPEGAEAMERRVASIRHAGALEGAPVPLPFLDAEVISVPEASEPGKRAIHGCCAALRAEAPIGRRQFKALMDLARPACVTAAFWSLRQITPLRKSGPVFVRVVAVLRPVSIAKATASVQDAGLKKKFVTDLASEEESFAKQRSYYVTKVCAGMGCESDEAQRMRYQVRSSEQVAGNTAFRPSGTRCNRGTPRR